MHLDGTEKEQLICERSTQRIKFLLNNFEYTPAHYPLKGERHPPQHRTRVTPSQNHMNPIYKGMNVPNSNNNEVWSALFDDHLTDYDEEPIEPDEEANECEEDDYSDSPFK